MPGAVRQSGAWNQRTSRQVAPDLEVLIHQVNSDVAASIVLDASAVASAPDGTREIKAGTPVVKDDTSEQYRKYVAATDDPADILGILCNTIQFPDGTSKSDAPAEMWNHGQWFRADRIVGWATDQADIRSALPTCKFT